MFRVELANPTKRFLKRCYKEIYERIRDKIKELCINPFPQNIVRVQGRKEKTFRVRVGDYRILYVVFHEENVLLIADIDKRPRVY